ncbi:MAG: hypothetical protein GY801_46310 [bacterium]|nr:hypothetical protein [bacterium]
MRKEQIFFKEASIFIGLIFPFIIILYKKYLFLDFWYDEILTFDHFVFVPLQKTLTDYHIPNNHIFFNLLNNLYLKLLGVQDLFSLMDAPIKIRLFMLGYTLSTLIIFFLLAKKFFNRFIAISSVLILTTTIPFINFAVQIRGYMLSILLLTSLLYIIWSFERHVKFRNLFGLIILAILALYTNPSNLYFIGSVLIFYFGDGILQFFRKKAVNSSDSRLQVIHYSSLLITLSLLTGIIVASCMYLPFLKSILGNRHYQSHGMFHAETLLSTMPKTFLFFGSQRYALIAIAVLGLLAWIVSSLRQRRIERHVRKITLCLFILIFPFILSFTRGDHPFYRVFLNLCPVFALSLAFGIDTFQHIWLKRSRRLSTYLVLGLLLYCYSTFFYEFHHKELRIIREHKNEQKLQNIYYNYYQENYTPARFARNLQRNVRKESIPVNLVPNVESYEIRRYFEKYQIPYVMAPSEFLINSQGYAYFVTPFTGLFILELKKVVPNVRCELLYPAKNFHKALTCRLLKIEPL